MEKETVNDLLRWFSEYVQTFKSTDSEKDKNIVLKEEHTHRVRQEILEIGRSLDLPEEDLRLAEVLALFHDVGRFPQYARYKTFSDRRSCDHVDLSVKVLLENRVLDTLDPSERDLILRTISYHNRAALPEDELERCLFFSKLLRDADKLDIWAVLLDYYHQRRRNGARNEALELDLPDTPGISDGVYQDLMAEEIVKAKNLSNLNDFKLLQASWIFDINFWPALVAVKDRGYLERIRYVLPNSEKVDGIFTLLKSRLEERIKAERPLD
ncbi:MAG TPA: HD domain-containing protein [Methanotrichaceae archaeon]|nr:HD domain-containing protein [Methanotrichaceae archaeon]